MTETHPITPPDELLEHWRVVGYSGNWQNALTLAARWGADQELEACCQWLPKLPPWSGNDLRKHRRPNPPTLKERALLAIDTAVADGRLSSDVSNVIRRALEALDD